MIQITIFIFIVILAFFTLFLSYQFRDVFLGVFSGILFLFIGLSLITGNVILTEQGQDMKYDLNSFDYQQLSPLLTATKYYVLQPTINPVIELGEDYTISTHIFTQDGNPINHTGLTCNLHLHGLKGNAIVAQNMEFESTEGYDYELEIGGGNFTTPGKYEYRIFCKKDNPASYGGVNSYLIVKEDSNYSNPMFATLSFLLSLFIIWQAVSFVREEKKQKEENNHEEEY